MSPGIAGWGLLLYLLAVLPWLAWRSARQLRAARANPETHPLPPLASILAGTLVMLLLLFVLAWQVGRTVGFDPFALPPIGARESLAGAACLAACFGLRWVSRVIRTEEERRTSLVHHLMPRTRAEWVLYLGVAITAGVAEETAYRGVGMALLTSSTGSAWLAGALLSLAFGIAHITQEWKSVWIVIVMAVLMHLLVAATHTLVIAMVVHAAYDAAAGVAGSREAARRRPTGPAASPPASA